VVGEIVPHQMCHRSSFNQFLLQYYIRFSLGHCTNSGVEKCGLADELLQKMSQKHMNFVIILNTAYKIFTTTETITLFLKYGK
jgi:hypothetical protein